MGYTERKRDVGTLSRHIRMKSWKFSDHLSQSARRGASSLLIRKMTRIGCTVHRGGIVSAISIAEIPSAQMSTCILLASNCCNAEQAAMEVSSVGTTSKSQRCTFPSYLDSCMTSGAIQWGVPMKVFRFERVFVS